MENFRLYRNTARSRNEYEYLLDIQSPLLSELASRLVIPLVQKNRFKSSIKILNPEISIAGIPYILLTQQMAAVPATVLGEPPEGHEVNRAEVLSAVDFLITGF